MPHIESDADRPAFQPVTEFSPYLTNALTESGVRFEELLFAQDELIIATSPETAELLTVDSDLHREEINDLIQLVIAEKATPFDPQDRNGDVDRDLYDPLTRLGKSGQYENLSLWEWKIMERTAIQVTDHFNEPLSASAYYVSSLDVLPQEKKQFLDDVITVAVGSNLIETYNCISNLLEAPEEEESGDEQKDLNEQYAREEQYFNDYIPKLMANYWIQNPAQNSVWVKLDDGNVDYYQAAAEFVTEQAHVPYKPYYDDIVLPVSRAVNAKLNEYGFSLVNYLFHEDENNNTIVYKGLPPVLFTVDWFARSIEATLVAMNEERGEVDGKGEADEEEMSSFRSYQRFLKLDASVLRVNQLEFDDVEPLAKLRVFTIDDSVRRKWETFARFGAIEKLYGARGWDLVMLLLTKDIADQLVLKDQVARHVSSLEDQPELWTRYMESAAREAERYLNSGDLSALRSGAMTPDDYTKKYLEEAPRHKSVFVPLSLSAALRKGADSLNYGPSPDDDRPWMVKRDK